MTKEAAQQMINAHVAQLEEHFTAVQILASCPHNNETVGISSGAGDWYARQGLAREFIQKAQAEELAFQINKPMDEGEE